MAIKKFKNVREMFDRVKEQHQKEANGKKQFSILDSKFWKPVLPKGKDKITYKIRFLPNPYSDTGIPYILRKLHGFGPQGNKFFETCPRNVGKDCPICEKVNPLFNSENPMEKKVALNRYAKKRYVANIMVIEDPREEGALNGKVFMFEFGVKIKEKLDKAIEMDFPYYCPYEGATFLLEVKQVSGYNNYDGSEFSRKVTKLFDGDEKKLEEIGGQCYDIQEEMLGEGKVRSYEQIAARYEAWEKGDRIPSFAKGETPAKTEEKTEKASEDMPDLIGAIEEAKEEKNKEEDKGEDKDLFEENSDSEEEIKEEIKEETKDSDDEDFDLEAFEGELDKAFNEG